MKETTIRQIHARQVFSGRGHPAVEATVVTENGAVGTAQCTAGMSIGTHEIHFEYDGGSKWRGMGVSNAVKAVNEVIAPALTGMDAARQFEIDHTMIHLGGPDAKLRLGGNAVGAVSAAVLKAASVALNIPLYQHIGGARAVTLPCAAFGAVTGSNRYSSGIAAATKPTYSFIAYDFPTFSEACYALWRVATKWDVFVQNKWGFKNSRQPSDDYTCAGFVCIPPGIIESDRVIWENMADMIAHCGYEGRMGFQIDMAADTYYEKETKTYFGLFNSIRRSRDEQIGMCVEMAQKYPFVIMEDPLNENDFEGHAILAEKTGIQIVGDDLFSTNEERVRYGIEQGSCNTVLLKVNQIGTITESLEMIELANQNGYGVMPCSSRGENIDICDYSVGINATTIRESCFGTPANRFLQIERELGSRARFAGKSGLKGAKFHGEESGAHV